MAESLNGGTAAPRRDRHANVQRRISERRRTQRQRPVGVDRTQVSPVRQSPQGIPAKAFASRIAGSGGPDIGAVAALAARRISTGGGGNPKLGRAERPGLGAQLTRRVDSGAIDQAQAQQTVQDRALLEQAFGPEWRDKVFGGAGVMQRARVGAATDPRKKALVAQLKKKRSSALEQARAKVEATAPGTI